MVQDTRPALSSLGSMAAQNASHVAAEGPFPAATTKVTLSIVIPCYNEEKTLEGCIDSVLAIKDETLDLELIVVDDCSKDKSYEVARGLAKRVPGLVLLRHEQNMGKGAALRTGIAKASG